MKYCNKHMLFFAILTAFLLAGVCGSTVLHADTTWTANSGTFVNLQTGGNYDNGVPTNENPAVISDVTLTLTATPDYNVKTFKVNHSTITIDETMTAERKFCLSSSGSSSATLELSNGSILNAQRIWATWMGDPTANFILNDTSAIHLSGAFTVHDFTQTGTGTGNVTLNGTSVIDGITELGVNHSNFVLSGDSTGVMTAATLLNRGNVTLNGATLSIGAYNAASTGTITLAGGTLKASAEITVNANIEAKAGTTSTLALLQGKNMTLSGNITGSGTINRTGSSNTLYLSGNNSGFSGTMNVSNTNTYISNVTAGSAAATWNIASPATLAMKNLGTGTVELGAVTGNGNLRNDSSGTVTLKVGGKNTSEVFSGFISNDYNSTPSTTSIIAIEKVGTGSWTLSGENRYTGDTTISEGTLIAGNNGAFGGSKIILAGGTLGEDAERTISNNIEAKTGTTSTLALLQGKNMTLSGNITGSGTINRTGSANTLYLSGNNSGFSGTMNVSGLNTYLSSVTAGSAAATWNITATLSAQNCGTGVIELGAVTGNGILRNDTPGLVTYKIGGKNTDAVFTGSIQDEFNGISDTKHTAVEKVGTGSWTLSGTHSFSGGSTVSGGRLNVQGALCGSLNVTNGGAFSPGQNGTEGLSLIGTAALEDVTVSGGTLIFDVNSTGADFMAVESILFEAGSRISVVGTDGFKAEPGQKYTFITSEAALPDLDWNSLLDAASAQNWGLYAVGNSLYAEAAVPEPSAFILLITGVSLIFISGFKPVRV